MSRARKDALRAEIDQKTAEYVDAAIADAMATLNAYMLRVESKVTKLKNEHEITRANLTNMQTQSTSASSDDKYALTKAKLVKLMKEMGMYD